MEHLKQMRRFFETGETGSYTFRKKQLQKLYNAVVKYETRLHDALYTDLKKSAEESWVTETGFLLSEISYALKHLKHWMQPQLVSTNLLNFPSTSRVMYEPLGVVLIISPWNYPFQLLMTPLVGAIAAGNCAVLKASEFAPATSGVMKKLIEENFDSSYIQFMEGDGAEVVPKLMNNFTFDHVFYTGSTAVGKLVYKMAAEKLVPVTLELGGKSPCVVEDDANLKVAARRIVLAKFSNAGQMCVAPDYVLVHERVKDDFVKQVKEQIHRFFGDKPEESYNYGRIINAKQFDRLATYLQQGNLVTGGGVNRDSLFIEPTVLDAIDLNSPIMQDEIFGPILPIISFNDAEQARKIIALNKNPLAFYLFTSSSTKEKNWLNSVAFGGGCVNNASWHLTNHHLPFGGRGFSGTGQYHGRYTFETFSHKKAIMKTPTWFDPSVKYPPFKGKLKLFKRIIG